MRAARDAPASALNAGTLRAVSDGDQLRVVLEARDWVVVEKPSGLLSVPGKGEEKQDCAVSRLRTMLPRAQGPMIVHRLDMDTSGLMVVALTADAQRALSAQFEGRVVEKKYTALVEGDVADDEGAIDLPLRLDVERRPYQIVDFVHGKPSRTRYRVLAREVDRTRVEMEPLTGRTHQLRVHAATPRAVTTPDGAAARGGLGCPILGDILYGAGLAGAPRLMLHASRLGFRDPQTHRWTEFESSPGW